MRVPIHPQDLNGNRGFKRIAKKLRRHWPVAKRLSHSRSLEILARGFGYHDYHDLVETSKAPVVEAPHPSEGDVSYAVMKAITNALQDEVEEVNLSKVVNLVAMLPLNSMTALSYFPPTKAWIGNELYPSAPSKPDHLEHKLESQSELSSTLRLVSTNTKSSHPSLEPLSPEEIQGLWMAANNSNSTLQQTLFIFLMSGLRYKEWICSTVNDLQPLGDNMSVTLLTPYRIRKFVGGVAGFNFGSSNASTISAYIKTKNLKDGDYLFPSKKDQNQPMSSLELIAIVKSWAEAAGFFASRVRPHSFRKSVAAQLSSTRISLESLERRLGHVSTQTTLYYLTGEPPKPDE